jgi:hypothetical protein
VAEADAVVAVEDRPRRGELDRRRDRQPERHSHHEQRAAQRQVEGTLDEPVGAGEDRRPQLEQRHALSGDVLGTLDQELGRLRCQPEPDPEPVRAVGDLQQLGVGQPLVGDDHLVEGVALENAAERRRAAQHRQRRRLGAGVAEDADEVVVESAAPRAERPVQVRDRIPGADEHDPTPHAREPQQVGGNRLVARAQHADQRDREHERGREEAEGREPELADPDAERDRDHGDDGKTPDDPAQPGAALARRVQARVPEDEHRHDGQERQPVGLLPPEDAPERRAVAAVDVSEDERGVDRDRQPGEIEHDQGGDAADAASHSLRSQVRERLGRADVAEHPGVARCLPRRRGLRLGEGRRWRLDPAHRCAV